MLQKTQFHRRIRSGERMGRLNHDVIERRGFVDRDQPRREIAAISRVVRDRAEEEVFRYHSEPNDDPSRNLCYRVDLLPEILGLLGSRPAPGGTACKLKFLLWSKAFKCNWRQGSTSKPIYSQMYGRGKLDLLQARVIGAS